jgi:hypothetical protein
VHYQWELQEAALMVVGLRLMPSVVERFDPSSHLGFKQRS